MLSKWNPTVCTLFSVCLLSLHTIIWLLVHVAGISSFLFIEEQCSTVWIGGDLSIHLLMDLWVVSSFWLLQIKLIWTFVYKSLYGHMLSLLLGRYLKVESPDHMETAKLLSKAAVPFYIPTSSRGWESEFPHILANTLYGHSLSFYYFFRFMLLKYSWFTMLCSFLLYSEVSQLYIYIHSFSYSFPLWFTTIYWI